MTELGSDLSLTIIRIAVGLIVAGHGAQKLFGVFEGPGMARWTGAVGAMGFAQPRLFAVLAAFAEFFGGLMLAVGLLVPLVAAALAVDMAVAITKAHWSKGFFVTKGGYEYSFALFVVFIVIGLNGATRYSLDEFFGIAAHSPAPFLVAFLISGALTAAAALAGPERGAQRPA